MKWSYLNYAAVKLNAKVDHNLEGGYYRVPRLWGSCSVCFQYSTLQNLYFPTLSKGDEKFFFNVYFGLNSIHTFTIVQNVNTFATHTSKSFQCDFLTYIL